MGAFMLIDGLVAILSLGLFHSWFTTMWMEATLGDLLHKHQDTKPTGPSKGEVIEEIRRGLARELGVDPSQINLINIKGEPSLHSVMPARKPDPEEWN